MIASRRLSDTGSAVVLEKKLSWSFIFQGLTVQQGFGSEKILEDWEVEGAVAQASGLALCDMLFRGDVALADLEICVLPFLSGHFPWGRSSPHAC